MNIKTVLKNSKIVTRLYSVLDLVKDKINYKFYSETLIWCFKFLPLKKNKIVFDNFLGKGYGGKPKIIAEEIIRRNLNCDLVWLVNKQQDMPSKIRQVKYGSREATKQLATAKMWVFNCRNVEHPKKRKNQVYLQTWHGDVGLKKVEAEVEQFLSPQYVNAAKNDGLICDLFTVTSEYQKQRVIKSFWYKGEIIKTEFQGIPSYAEKKYAKENVCCYFDLPIKANFILYVPTFRNDYRYNYFSIDFNKSILAARQKYGGSWYIIVRLHPNVSEMQNAIEYNERILNGTQYGDIMDLIYSAEFVISDYSNLLFKAMRYEIKSLIYAPDYINYIQKERALTMNIKSLPAPFSENSEQLCSQISEFDDNLYLEKCRELNKEFGYVGTKKDVDNIIKWITDNLFPTNS